jgi:uncharacterized protein (TIGR02996 family)
MGDVMAIVSKAIFEKAAGKSPKLGIQLGMDRYVTTNKTFETLKGGGKIYLVTVRPPNEALWLVAVIDNPKFDGKQWVAKPSVTPLTDISSLRSKIKFESGKGITAAAGALGMSLQTPRAMAPADAQMIDALAAGNGAPAVASPAPVAAPAVSASDARRSELVAAIVADPDNALTRKVYADELTHSNDPRGELILVELALEGPLSIRKRERLSARRTELMKAHGKAWFPYKLAYRTRGGFVHAITGAFGQITSVAPQLFATEPVVEVTVTAIDDAKIAKKLAAAAWLTNLRLLVVRGSIGDGGFAALCNSKGTANLRSLNVTANGVSGDALEALGDNLPECTTLVLTANPIGDDGITHLRNWKHLSQIETLYLSKCDLTSDGVTKLFAAALPCLRKLTLSGNDLDDGVAAIIAKRAAALPALRRLELTSTDVTLAGVTTLAAKLPNVSRIDVRKSGIDEDDARSLDPRVRVS